MKKFRFTLQTLKDYRENVLDSEKNKLSGLRRELLELQTELELLLNLIETKNDELAELLVKGTNPVEIATRKKFISLKHQEVIMKSGEVEKKEAEVEKQLNVVLRCTQDVSTLEKLEEKQIEEYKAAEQKENELFIEEFVSNADFRKGQNKEQNDE